MNTGKTLCTKHLLFSSRVAESAFFSLALFLAPLAPVYSSPEGTAANGMISNFELSRLIEISTRLGALNETLKNELESSRQNSSNLSATLEASKTEVERLKEELESLRITSIRLASTAESSRTTSNELQKALAQAETSLQNWEASFEAYRNVAGTELLRLEKSRSRWRWATGISTAFALSGWLAFAATGF